MSSASFEGFIAELSATSAVVTAHQADGHVVVSFQSGSYPGYVALPAFREMVQRHGLKIAREYPDNPQPMIEGEFALWPSVQFYVVTGEQQ